MLAWGLTLLLGVTGLIPSQETKASQNPPPGSRPGSQAREPRGASPAAAHPQPAAAPSLFPEGYLDHAALTRRAAARGGGVPRPGEAGAARQDDAGARGLAGDPRHGRGVESPATRKPAILIVANLEADHVVGSQVALGLIEQVAARPGLERRLERCTIYVVPRLNPDGAERVLGRPRGEFRTNLQPLDRDRDGRSGEDGPDDINGDGLVLRMRVKDGKATLVPDSADPRLLRKADPAKGERPVYSEYAEGIDNDRDGKLNEDPPGGRQPQPQLAPSLDRVRPRGGIQPRQRARDARPDPVRVRPPRDRRRLELRPGRQPRVAPQEARVGPRRRRPAPLRRAVPAVRQGDERSRRGPKPESKEKDKPATREGAGG